MTGHHRIRRYYQLLRIRVIVAFWASYGGQKNGWQKDEFHRDSTVIWTTSFRQSFFCQFPPVCSDFPMNELLRFSSRRQRLDDAAGFIKNLLQQRLCSSFASGLATAQRMLRRECPGDEEENPAAIEAQLSTLTGAETVHLQTILEELSRPEARDAFELRYRETIDPEKNQWHRCAKVLSRRDVEDRLSEPW